MALPITGLNLITVRRHPTDQKKAQYQQSDIKDLRWDFISGGHRKGTSHPTLFGYVWCNQMVSGEVAHSGIHEDCPHRIKVSINRNDNPSTFDQLAQLAGPMPTKGRRKALTSAEKKNVIYLMWTAKTSAPQYNTSAQTDTPDSVYANSANAGFIRRCQKTVVTWGLLSPGEGVWLSTDIKAHDPKRLSELSPEEKQTLVADMQAKLAGYAKIKLYIARTYDKTPEHEAIEQQAGFGDRLARIHKIMDIGTVWSV